jgi:hypothetical protein
VLTARLPRTSWDDFSKTRQEAKDTMLLRTWLACVTTALLLALPAAAAAQTSLQSPVPKGDVFGGVAILGEAGYAGALMHASAAYRFNREVGVVGDVVFNRLGTSTLAGVRVYGSRPKITPFFQLLAPLELFAIQPGGGVDVSLGRRLAVRVGVDVSIDIFAEDDDRNIRTRASVGGVLKLGRQ